MSFKNFSKFNYPYTNVKISSFEEAKKHAVMYDDIKKRVLDGHSVYFYIVSGLVHESTITYCYTNKSLFWEFKPSDIGNQIGYEYVGKSLNKYIITQTDRSFITDIGINKDKRHNKYLVFFNEKLAKMYLNYMLTDKKERAERNVFLARCNMFDSYYWEDIPYVDEPY